jgi:hypothetical protein
MFPPIGLTLCQYFFLSFCGVSCLDKIYRWKFLNKKPRKMLNRDGPGHSSQGRDVKIIYLRKPQGLDRYPNNRLTGIRAFFRS